MPSYEELVQDIGMELGGEIPPNLPFLIRSVEREIWQQFWFLGKQRTFQFTLPAGTSGLQSLSGLTTVNPSLVLMVEGVFGESENPLTRVSMHRFLRMVREGKQAEHPEVYTLNVETDEIGFYPTPRRDVQLELLVRLRDEYLQAGDTEQNKVLLGVGYELLKWGVLAKRFFVPDKIEVWRQRYADAVASVLAQVSRRRWSYRGGTQYHDSPTSFE